MHDRIDAMLDQAGHGDSNADDGARIHARLGDHRLDALDDVADRVLGIQHGQVGY
jgi:alpha-beta hydrolase superfamily lysophospholipase